jgi:hypothetical protein
MAAAWHAILQFLCGVIPAQQVAQLRAGHFALEFGPRQHRRKEAVLVQQHAFVEGHVGDADGALVAQCAIVGKDGDLMNGAGFIGVQAAVAVVIADRVGGAEIRDPTGFEQRDEPGLMLSRDRDGSGHRQRQRASHSDGVVQNPINAAQVCATEGRQTMGEKLIQGGAFVHPADVHVMAVFGGHYLPL